MSLSLEDDDEFQEVDCFVLALEELSRKAEETVQSYNVLSSSEPQFTGWIADRTIQNENKPVCRRSAPSKDSKEHRSSTPRKAISSQFTRNREDIVEFKHYLQPERYIEEYRNEKAIRQENAYKELLRKNDRRRTSDTSIDFGKNCDHLETAATKHVPSVPSVVSMKEEPTLHEDNAVNPLIVVSSKELCRPANLPMSGQFQGRKLQWRPTIGNKKIPQPKGSQWSQAHIDVTLEITSQGHAEVGHVVQSSKQSEDLNPLQERRPSANLVIKRAELNTTAISSRAEPKTSTGPHAIRTQYSPIEKCDAWVKNRENELGTISRKSKERYNAKTRILRGYNTTHVSSSQLALRGNALTSPHKDVSESASSIRCSSSAPGMDYSKYTDMFKNVLEFYGTRRLRPKSHSAIDQLLSMKS